MKKYLKTFLVLFSFLASHTIVMAVDMADDTPMEVKHKKTKSVDSEEESKDFKPDLIVSYHAFCTSAKTERLGLLSCELHHDAYLMAPFKPPRA